jgi:prepilin-type processing-associated H-X9-DG protein
MGGAFQLGTGFRFEEFTDGLSNTLLIGEKTVPIGGLGVGWLDCSIYNGDYHQCSARPVGINYPPTTDPRSSAWAFGSWHTRVVQFCFADGHVKGITDSIDPFTYELLGQRNDGMVIPDY